MYQTTDARELLVPLTPNGNGAQTYLNDKLLGDPHCPLAQGEKARAQAVDYGILFVPEDDDREYTIEPQEDTDGTH